MRALCRDVKEQTHGDAADHEWRSATWRIATMALMREFRPARTSVAFCRMFSAQQSFNRLRVETD